jgi:hypothetical protein
MSLRKIKLWPAPIYYTESPVHNTNVGWVIRINFARQLSLHCQRECQLEIRQPRTAMRRLEKSSFCIDRDLCSQSAMNYYARSSA